MKDAKRKAHIRVRDGSAPKWATVVGASRDEMSRGPNVDRRTFHTATYSTTVAGSMKKYKFESGKMSTPNSVPRGSDLGNSVRRNSHSEAAPEKTSEAMANCNPDRRSAERPTMAPMTTPARPPPSRASSRPQPWFSTSSAVVNAPIPT